MKNLAEPHQVILKDEKYLRALARLSSMGWLDVSKHKELADSTEYSCKVFSDILHNYFVEKKRQSYQLPTWLHVEIASAITFQLDVSCKTSRDAAIFLVNLIEQLEVIYPLFLSQSQLAHELGAVNIEAKLDAHIKLFEKIYNDCFADIAAVTLPALDATLKLLEEYLAQLFSNLISANKYNEHIQPFLFSLNEATQNRIEGYKKFKTIKVDPYAFSELFQARVARVKDELKQCINSLKFIAKIIRAEKGCQEAPCAVNCHLLAEAFYELIFHDQHGEHFAKEKLPTSEAMHFGLQIAKVVVKNLSRLNYVDILQRWILSNSDSINVELNALLRIEKSTDVEFYGKFCQQASQIKLFFERIVNVAELIDMASNSTQLQMNDNQRCLLFCLSEYLAATCTLSKEVPSVHNLTIPVIRYFINSGLYSLDKNIPSQLTQYQAVTESLKALQQEMQQEVETRIDKPIVNMQQLAQLFVRQQEQLEAIYAALKHAQGICNKVDGYECKGLAKELTKCCDSFYGSSKIISAKAAAFIGALLGAAILATIGFVALAAFFPPSIVTLPLIQAVSIALMCKLGVTLGGSMLGGVLGYTSYKIHDTVSYHTGLFQAAVYQKAISFIEQLDVVTQLSVSVAKHNL